MYCNGAQTKAQCANFKRTDKTFTFQILPVKKNGAVKTGMYPNGKCLVVLDLDTAGRIQSTETLPETYTIQTGSGGLHLYFWLKDGVLNNKANPIFHLTDFALSRGLKGVDVRGEGGIVFAPGSKFIEHKNSYKIIDDNPILEITTADFQSILSRFVKESPKFLKQMRRGFLDILDGHFQIQHEFQPETDLPEFLYWSGFWREYLNCGGDLEWAFKVLEVTQPEFDAETTLQQLKYLAEADKRPSRAFYLRLFPNARDHRKFDWGSSQAQKSRSSDNSRIDALEQEVKKLQEAMQTLLEAVKDIKERQIRGSHYGSRIALW